MSVWLENLRRLLKQKEVVILHGNIRDIAYIKSDGSLIRGGLTPLIREIGRELGYQRAVFWGVFFDTENQGHSPMWSLERIEPLNDIAKPEIKERASQEKEIQLLTNWLNTDIRDISQNSIFIINYIDKITPFSSRGAYSRDIALLITLIQKIIENITENNRLIMIALQDTMIPLEYYTNSPKVSVMEIPIPDKDEREIYFSRHLSAQGFPRDQVELIANITDGLYVRDMDNILRDVIIEKSRLGDMSYSILRKIVNRYRIGSENDPWSKLPLGEPPKGLIDSAKKWFSERVIGQDYAIEKVVNAIKKARAGVVGLASGQASKPRAVFFFAGPTGTGKTFLAKKLAEYLFDSDEAFIRLDMSEFKEEHTVSKMIGSPPGYVGYEKGGQLTNAVKNKPFSVILFDEIEKAHPKIMDIFLQILDDGRLTDSRGQTVFFTESIVIFTSNIGTRTTDSRGQQIKERDELEKLLKSEYSDKEQKIREHFIKAVQEFFMYEISRPELLNRIGPNIVSFNYINNEDSKREIINSKLKDISNNFKDKFSHQGHRLIISPSVTEYFLNKYREFIDRFGGRGLVNAIDDEIGYLLADQLLISEKYQLSNISFLINLENDKNLVCRRET